MDIELIRAINRLWLPVYPGLARQAADHAPPQLKKILEVGCFSGGTGLELLKLLPPGRLTIALELPDLARTFFEDWQVGPDDRARIDIVSTPLVPLSLPDSSFDLIVCRGVFFFLDADGWILPEMHRLLAPGGACFAGGGFGSHTPQAVIEPISDESRRLNYALGKKLVSAADFSALLSCHAVPAHIIEDGGLWAVMRKKAQPA